VEVGVEVEVAMLGTMTTDKTSQNRPNHTAQKRKKKRGGQTVEANDELKIENSQRYAEVPKMLTLWAEHIAFFFLVCGTICRRQTDGGETGGHERGKQLGGRRCVGRLKLWRRRPWLQLTAHTRVQGHVDLSAFQEIV
jgi:hypothetical protein